MSSRDVSFIRSCQRKWSNDEAVTGGEILTEVVQRSGCFVGGDEAVIGVVRCRWSHGTEMEQG
ncbi:hypothetical protein SLEP1_g49762 [Rubroshorea leprosula]|uniref:Uncharacterized protein n=1 Tax=Rubroshorea leprosula TaxID=152421 RepID=A0AAV5LXV1_9ROSI|nr:hypothetical protein SLEP1_g49762 [Rubroshorea leprosula]